MRFIKIIKNYKFFKLFSNIYILITTVFIIWILFLDSNSVVVNIKLKSQINDLENKINQLEKEIEIHDVTGAYGAARVASLDQNNFESFSKNISNNDYIKSYVPSQKKQQYIDAYETWKINLKKLIDK